MHLKNVKLGWCCVDWKIGKINFRQINNKIVSLSVMFVVQCKRDGKVQTKRQTHLCIKSKKDDFVVVFVRLFEVEIKKNDCSFILNGLSHWYGNSVEIL